MKQKTDTQVRDICPLCSEELESRSAARVKYSCGSQRFCGEIPPSLLPLLPGVAWHVQLGNWILVTSEHCQLRKIQQVRRELEHNEARFSGLLHLLKKRQEKLEEIPGHGTGVELLQLAAEVQVLMAMDQDRWKHLADYKVHDELKLQLAGSDRLREQQEARHGQKTRTRRSR